MCVWVSVHARMCKDNIEYLFRHSPPFIWRWGLPLNAEHSILATMTFCSGDSLPPSPGCWESQAATTPTWFYVGSEIWASHLCGKLFTHWTMFLAHCLPLLFEKGKGMWYHCDSQKLFSVNLGKVLEVHELIFFLCKTKTETFTEPTPQGYIWLQFRFFHYTSATEHYVYKGATTKSSK